MNTETQQSELVSVNQMSKEELAKVISELINENKDAQNAIINLACAYPNIMTQI